MKKRLASKGSVYRGITAGALLLGGVCVAGGFANGAYAAVANRCGDDKFAYAILDSTDQKLSFVCNDESHTDKETSGTKTYYTVKTSGYSYTNLPSWAGSDSSSPFDYRTDITKIVFDESFDEFQPTSTAYWFTYDGHVNSITGAENLDTSKVTNMSGMFMAAGSQVEGDESEFKIEGMDEWDTSKVTNMALMFSGVGRKAATIDLGGLSAWNTKSVTNMSSMFNGAGQQAENFRLDFAGWDTSKVTDMEYMFAGAGSESETFAIEGLKDWDVSSVTNMQSMFEGAGKEAEAWVLDLANWGTKSVTNMNGMFKDAATLTTIKVGPNWTTESLTEDAITGTDSTGKTDVFKGALKLVGGNGTEYDAEHVDADYAVIDTILTPGYLTDAFEEEEEEEGIGVPDTGIISEENGSFAIVAAILAPVVAAAGLLVAKMQKRFAKRTRTGKFDRH